VLPQRWRLIAAELNGQLAETMNQQRQPLMVNDVPAAIASAAAIPQLNTPITLLNSRTIIAPEQGRIPIERIMTSRARQSSPLCCSGAAYADAASALSMMNVVRRKGDKRRSSQRRAQLFQRQHNSRPSAPTSR
jgi:hypothetical protein